MITYKHKLKQHSNLSTLNNINFQKFVFIPDWAVGSCGAGYF